MSAADPTTGFREALTAAGLGAPPEIIPDGKIHRFRADNEKSGSNAWYVFHQDPPAAGAFGNWRTGETGTWCARAGGTLDPDERRRLEAHIRQARQAQESDRRQRHEAAARRALDIWQHAKPADPAHPYLLRKGIQPHGTRQTGAALLLVPVTLDGRIVSVQTINAAGDKLFLSGGRTAGGYYRLPDAPHHEPLLIGEGFATVASLTEETSAAGIVAFNAGNLVAVAKAMRERHPAAEIIVAGDNDRHTEGNPGATQAQAAARAVGGKVLIPEFDPDEPGTDWNDWLLQRRAPGAGGHHGE